jgi:hypothetical protein
VHSGSARTKHGGGTTIHLFCINFAYIGRNSTNLHFDPYSRKFPSLAHQGVQELRSAVTDQRRDGARGGCEHQLRACSIRDSSLGRESGWQHASQPTEQDELSPAPVDESSELSLGGEKIA